MMADHHCVDCCRLYCGTCECSVTDHGSVAVVVWKAFVLWSVLAHVVLVPHQWRIPFCFGVALSVAVVAVLNLYRKPVAVKGPPSAVVLSYCQIISSRATTTAAVTLHIYTHRLRLDWRLTSVSRSTPRRGRTTPFVVDIRRLFDSFPHYNIFFSQKQTQGRIVRYNLALLR